MLRIVGVERDWEPQKEFILLQNHGVLKVPLRGHMIAHEDVLSGDCRERIFSFQDEEPIPAGCYVAVITGNGIDGWRRDIHGNHVYQVYWGRSKPVWVRDERSIHLLNVVHSNKPKAEGILISR